MLVVSQNDFLIVINNNFVHVLSIWCDTTYNNEFDLESNEWRLGIVTKSLNQQASIKIDMNIDPSQILAGLHQMQPVGEKTRIDIYDNIYVDYEAYHHVFNLWVFSIKLFQYVHYVHYVQYGHYPRFFDLSASVIHRCIYL